MIEVLKPTLNSADDCMGCEACINVCPTDALSIQYDCLGFRYPQLDIGKCIDCGKCNRVCPALNSRERSIETPMAVYAMRNCDMEVVDESRSGGVFTAISDNILSDGGAISGAVIETDLLVSHKIAYSQKDRNFMRGSKYVQSRVNLVFREILQELKNGQKVMFTGTPCQVYGLKKIIPIRYAHNLVTVDIICHGVCSPAAWKGFLKYISKKEKDTVTSVCFRDKKMVGWDCHKESFVFKHKGKVISPFTFYNDVWLRKACYKCPFASISRVGDITLGDLWNWRKAAPDMNTDNKGVSSVFINTISGEKIISTVMDKMKSKKITVELAMQPNLIAPTTCLSQTCKILSVFSSKGYSSAIKRMGLIGWRKKVRVLKVRLKKFIK